MRLAVQTILTLIVAGIGGFIGFASGLPAGFLAGAVVSTAVAIFAGFRAVVPTTLRDTIFVFIGLSMGASVAQDSLALIGQWPITMAALAVELVLIVVLSAWLLQKFFRIDVGTAYLSSFPGHLSFILAIATTGVGNSRQIVVIQVMRVMMLTLCVPVGALFLPVGLGAGGPSADVMSLPMLALMVAGCTGAGYLFTRLGVPAGYILGSMAFAVGMKFSGLFTGAMHPWLINACFIAMGALIGSRFLEFTWAELRTALGGAVAVTVLTIAIVTIFAVGLTFVVDMPFGQLWLGFAPGGLESMGALAIVLGYDTAFVAAHHFVRVLALGFAIPAMAALVRRLEGRESIPPSGEPRR